MKEQILNLKEDIKLLSEKQKVLKDQRKTVHNQLERMIDPWEARNTHILNREKLRHMFILYGHVRHRPVGYEPTSPVLLEKLREVYFPISEVKIPDEVIQELKYNWKTEFFSAGI
jgi:hypothetical protein